MLVVLSGFVGAILGILATMSFNIWKFHRDERTARVDEICSLIAKASNDAAEYWSRSFSQKEIIQQRIQEAKLFASQAMIDGIFDDLRPVLGKAETDAIGTLFVDLYDALTGGQFSEWPRDPDPTRLIRAAEMATSSILAIRRAHRQTIPLGRLFKAYHENRLRQLDMRSCDPGT